MELTPRLRKIAEEICPGETVGDIGTDHGYLPIYLIQNRIAKTVIATDINQEPLNAAVKNIRSYGLENNIQTKLGPGTIPLEAETLDAVIIAGMGGKLITEILKNSRVLKISVDRLILQPMQQQEELRKYLFTEGYIILKDFLVEEGRRIYEILVVSLKPNPVEVLGESKESMPERPATRKIATNYPESYAVYKSLIMELGFFLFENPKELTLKFLEQRIAQMEKIISETSNATSEAAVLMNQKAKRKAEKLKEVKKCL